MMTPLQNPSDPWHLERFILAQNEVYDRVLQELKQGSKQTHWIWFIFPNLKGLGKSLNANFFALASYEEALAYSHHGVLGARLRECTRILMALPPNPLPVILGSIDSIKFRSCMTLFKEVSPEEVLFTQALERYCGGQPDPLTIKLLGQLPR